MRARGLLCDMNSCGVEARARAFWQYFLRRSFSSLARSSMARSMNERGTPPSCAAGNVSDCVPQDHGQGHDQQHDEDSVDGEVCHWVVCEGSKP